MTPMTPGPTAAHPLPRSISLESPIGPLTLAATERAVVGLTFPDDARASRWTPLGRAPSGSLLAAAKLALDRYFDGRELVFDLPLDAAGTPFQREVWAALRRIPPGETRSYAEIARAIGRPDAVRAVGAANGKNPISVIVPCHRVIGSDASLTGYAGGLPAKAWLLAHEGSASRRIGSRP